MKQTESQLKSAILEWLNLQFMTFAFVVTTTGIPDSKVRGGFRRNQNRGVADILGVKNGKFFALEVKLPGKKASDQQRHFLERVAIAEGYACIVFSLDDAIDAFNEI